MAKTAVDFDFSKVPGTVTIANVSERDVKIGISGYNQGFILEAGTSIRVAVTTSSEIMGYMSQASEDVTVTIDEEEEETATE